MAISNRIYSTGNYRLVSAMKEERRFLISAVAFCGIIGLTSSSPSIGLTQQKTSTHPHKAILDYFSTRKRWWDEDPRYCGKSAPLYEGFYPVCDPFNPETRCCSDYGHCGSTAKHCDCKGCVDYSKNPDMLVEEPVKPTRQRRWMLRSEIVHWSLPVCGPNAPSVDGYEAICNPDDELRHCCSESGYCGTGPSYCDCKGCKDFKKIPLSESEIPIHGKSELRNIILNYFRKETQKRWWAWDDDPEKRGMCGRRAPLYNGSYPVCDPFNPKAPCCNEYGYCGEKCHCSGCVDYLTNPEKLLEESVSPSQEIKWHLISDNIDWDLPNCGPKAPKVNESEAICNPDDDYYHCCSAAGYCGHGTKYCACEGCKDFRNNNYEVKKPSRLLRSLILDYFSNKRRWWTKEDDPKKVGLCGKRAPLYEGYYPVCDPFSNKTSCCSDQGHCGSSKEHCDCAGCVNYSKNPEMLVSERPSGELRVQWHTLSEEIAPSHPKCGPRAPLVNGKLAICNPDDDHKYCCSKHGFCGIGPKYCDCDGCVNYRNNTQTVGIRNSGSADRFDPAHSGSESFDHEIGEVGYDQSTKTIDHN